MAGHEVELDKIVAAGIVDTTAAAEEIRTHTALDREIARVTNGLKEIENKAQEAVKQAEFVRTHFFGEFVPDMRHAAGLVQAIADEGIDAVPLDVRSLVAGGESPAAMHAYFEPFTVLDSETDYPFPVVTFPVMPVFDYGGKKAHITDNFYITALDKNIVSPDLAKMDVSLPVLVDPRPMSMREFVEAEGADFAHAKQISDMYRMAVEAQGEDGRRFAQPEVVRMIAVLPAGTNYETHYAPEVRMGTEDFNEKRAWNPYLLFRGELNPSGNFLRMNSTWSGKRRIPLNVDGKEALFRVSTLTEASAAADEASLVPVAGRERNSLGIGLFPYKITDAPHPVHRVRESRSASAAVYLDRGPERSVAVGAADISAGEAGWFTAGKRSTGFLGERLDPVPGGVPRIYSVKFFTATKK